MARIFMWISIVAITMCLFSSRGYALNGQNFPDEYKLVNLPDFNFCIYSVEIVRLLTDCFLDELPRDFSIEFKATVIELFGGQPFAESIKMVCRNNGDDGYMLLKTWLEELEDDVRPKALFSAWTCIERHEAVYAKDVE